jgi:hypothetical protein
MEIHPVAYIVNEKANSWPRRQYFYQHYFNRTEIIKLQTNRDRIEDNKTFKYRLMVEDGYSIEESVKLYQELLQEKRRLKSKLNDLNINPWEITSCTHFPRKNKNNNFSEAYISGVEIIY